MIINVNKGCKNWVLILDIQALEGKDVKDLLLNVGSGGGAAAAPTAGGAAAGGDAAAEESKEEEKKEEGKDYRYGPGNLLPKC
jgi:ribosomal protein L12E/L44/L45/RPP1/RPP2